MLLIDVKGKLDQEEIVELLEYSVFPDPDAVAEAVKSYKEHSEFFLYGLEAEEEIVGIIGFELRGGGELIIRHLAVKPDARGLGFGRGLILETIALKQPAKIVVETEEDAVDFYRAIGFEIVSLGEKVPGVERFTCTYVTEV